MAFNPLREKGVPLEDQFRSWHEVVPEPLDPMTVHPHTQTRVILMNGIEAESILFSHQFHRHTDNLELRRALATSRRIEQLQQKSVNWLLSGQLSPLETTIAYEQTAVDLTSWLARHEPDPYLKMALDFALLEDFDHLYRYANLYELIGGRQAELLTGELTEISPGRPTPLHHIDPHDSVRAHFDTHSVHPLSRLHVMTIVAAEQQTMTYYMNHGPDFVEPVARRLYAEIAQVEEEHVTHYGSLLDPLDSWLQQWVFHEYNEVYLYHSMAQQEPDARVRTLWEQNVEMEIGQLHAAAAMLQRYEGIDAEEILPAALPDVPVTFEPNKGYVREVLAATVDLRADGLGFTPESELPSGHRYRRFQEVANARGAPSDEVLQANVDAQGRDYRYETEGPSPVVDLREPLFVTTPLTGGRSHG
jgi:hypothetical protein